MNMRDAFNDWWSNGHISKDNPFEMGTQQFWAWEGYKAATERASQISYELLDDQFLSGHGYTESVSREINE